MSERVLIVCDDKGWYVRRVCAVEHNLDRDQKIYYCDEPVGGRFRTLKSAGDAALRFRRSRRSRRRSP